MGSNLDDALIQDSSFTFVETSIEKRRLLRDRTGTTTMRWEEARGSSNQPSSSGGAIYHYSEELSLSSSAEKY